MAEGKEMRKEQALQLFKKMKPLIDEKIVWFAYYNDKPIAMFINIPDLNQYFKLLTVSSGYCKNCIRLAAVARSLQAFHGIVFPSSPNSRRKG